MLPTDQLFAKFTAHLLSMRDFIGFLTFNFIESTILITKSMSCAQSTPTELSHYATNKAAFLLCPLLINTSTPFYSVTWPLSPFCVRISCMSVIRPSFNSKLKI